MRVLQVKQYNKEVAQVKHQKALEYWRNKKDGYGYPIKSMFYFVITDNKGYIKEREKGYIAFNDNKAIFEMSIKKAIEKFNQ